MPTPPAPTFDPVPDRRAYVHQRCGGATVISDWAFRALCNPFELVSSTECAACRQQRPLREFAWEDTGETLDAYRARLRALFPGHATRRRLVGFGSVIGGTVLGVAAGLPFASTRSIAGPAIGALAGFVLGVAVAVMDMAKHRVDGRRFR